MAMKVALLGCGVVGSEVVRLVNEQSEELAARIGTSIGTGRGSSAMCPVNQ